MKNSVECGAVHESLAFNPAGGELFVSLQGSVACNVDNNGSISQNIPTEIGRQYEVSLEVYIDEYDEMLVQADGLTFLTISVLDNPIFEWVRVSATFVAVSNDTELKMISVGTSDAPNCLEAQYAEIDNIELREVLEGSLADLTGDGELNFFDVSVFLTYFQFENPIADFTGDGQFNFFDISAFLQLYAAGCP